MQVRLALEWFKDNVLRDRRGKKNARDLKQSDIRPTLHLPERAALPVLTVGSWRA
ncbi:hypothetical protein [Streptomyces sp. NBC_01477]|uniref:hypothetical protein n=1 Tax=Streptomyces sp. NBC_01477 TaxID=2976015 RepID=UPI002E3066EC|nr:hypothetical protein [Streptomyces sp. NBC_01477]